MLNIEGRNIADEGFSGSNVRDSNTGRFTSEGANKLAQSVRAGMSMTSTRDSSATNISAAVSKLTEAISNDTQNFQELLNKQDEKTKKLFDSYIKSLESGKTSNIEKAMEKFLLSMEKDTSKKFEKIIDAVGQRKSLNEGNTVKQKFANFMGADADKGFGGSIAQAFSEPGRMFGKSGLLGTGLFSGGPSAAQQQVTAELGKENQTKGIAELATNSVALDNSEDKSVSEIQAKNNKEKVAEKGSSNKKGPEKVIIADQPIITKDAPKTMSGIDVNDPAAEQLQVLKDILEELKLISGKPAGSGGLGSIIPDILNRRPRTGPRTGPRPGPGRGPGPGPGVNPGQLKDGVRLNSAGRPIDASGRFVATADAYKPTSRMSSLASKATTFARKAPLIGTALAVGAAGYDAYQGYNEADQLIESNAINPETGETFTEQDETAGKVEAVSAGVGAVGGTLSGAAAGATAGAILGSVVPVVGTAIGGFVGGAIGGAVGYLGGKKAGEVVGDVATTTSGEEALDAASESGLYNKDYLGNSEINPEILAVTEDTRQLNAILADGDLSAEDHSKVLTRLESLSQGTATPAATSGAVEGTATPAATTPELVEGTAENVSTTPLTRRQRLERDLGFENTTSGAPIPILTPEEKSERAMELAEQMNLDPTNLDVEYTGQVPAVINGVAVPSELLTEDEKYQLDSAKAAREMLQGTQSEVAARQATLNNRGIETGEANASYVTQSPSVTSNAIQNMTNLSTPSTQSAPPIINNITNNNTSASPAAPQILTTPSTPRNNSNIIQRFQDRTFAGI